MPKPELLEVSTIFQQVFLASGVKESPMLFVCYKSKFWLRTERIGAKVGSKHSISARCMQWYVSQEYSELQSSGGDAGGSYIAHLLP